MAPLPQLRHKPSSPTQTQGLMTAKPLPPHRRADRDGEDELLEDRGRGLGLRLLALLGAFSFLMLGISSMAPLFQPAPSPPLPDQRRSPTA